MFIICTFQNQDSSYKVSIFLFQNKNYCYKMFVVLSHSIKQLENDHCAHQKQDTSQKMIIDLTKHAKTKPLFSQTFLFLCHFHFGMMCFYDILHINNLHLNSYNLHISCILPDVLSKQSSATEWPGILRLLKASRRYTTMY